MKGMGIDQVAKSRKAKIQLLHYLSDGKWHRYNEIKNHKRSGRIFGKVSPATLSKHLKELVKCGFLEKKMDRESGEYPYPVSYRICEKAIFHREFALRVYRAYGEFAQFLKETKDQKEFLDSMTEFFHNGCLSILKYKKQNKNLEPKDIQWMTDLFFFPLEQLVDAFIERY